MGAEAERIVRSWIARVWNARELALLDEVHPARFRNEDADSTPDDARAWFREMWAVFPDLHYEIDELLVADDQVVVVRWTATGTHEGTLWGTIPPTGRRATWRGIHVVRVNDDRITEVHAVSNMAAIGPQLGLEMRQATPP